MINNAVIMGRICNDIEVRKTQSGVSVCRFTVAVDRQFTKETRFAAVLINPYIGDLIPLAAEVSVYPAGNLTFAAKQFSKAAA